MTREEMQQKLDSIKERFAVEKEEIGWHFQVPRIEYLIEEAEKALREPYER